MELNKLSKKEVILIALLLLVGALFFYVAYEYTTVERECFNEWQAYVNQEINGVTLDNFSWNGSTPTYLPT